MTQKFSKQESNYRPRENPDFQCGNCIHFLPTRVNPSKGGCTLVEGLIRADYVCEYWEPDPTKEPGEVAYELIHGRAAEL